jgi:TonB-linked SusC/RagA family outer membrane protein
VKVKGSSKGVSADKDGNFKIDAESDAVLEFSAISFESFEVPVGSQTVLGVTLQSKDGLSEVVVTALGVKRSKNTLPYAAQQLKGDEISGARTANVGSALSGKVSGLQIQQGNSIGGSTNVVIRGAKSLTNSNQALFVVDGVPIDNSNTNSSNQQTGRGGYDYGNAAADINPDDIESMNVLKGAAASALYGSRAANGVIMITTKKGKKGLGVTINSGVTYGSIDKDTYAKYQDQYGAGYAYNYGAPAPDAGFLYFDVDGDGVKDRVVPTTEDASYGQKYNPNLMVFHWDAFDPTSPNYMKARPWVAAKNKPTEFFENPFSTNNSVMLDGANDKGTFKLGYTRSDEKGILPNSRVTKNIINFGGTYNLTNKLTATAAVNFSKVDGKGRYGTGYDNKNINQNFRQWYQTNMDVLEQKAAYDRTGQNITWNWADPSSPDGLKPIYTDNPYFMRHESYQNDTRNRVFGNVALNYKATDWLNFLGRISLDSYDELQEERNAVGSVDPASYSRYTRHYHELNYDLMANFDRDLNEDFNLKALAGVNMRRSVSNSEFAQTNGGLVVPKLYSLSNSLNPISSPIESYQPKAVDGYFGGVTLGYREFLTLDGSFRRDRSSTLPVDMNAYNYYSVSGSWLFSHHLKDLNWLSFGKLRANYAEVGNDAAWGMLADVYDKPTPFGNGILFSLPNTKNNEELKPERTYSKELGLEVAFLKNRLGFDVSYYITNTKNQIIPVAISTATGYSSKVMNAGDIQNKGVELSLYGTPVKTRNFSWNVNLNFTRNRNEVIELYEESKNLQLASYQAGVSVNATVGQPYGTLQGKTWVLVNGQRVVDDVPLLASGKKNPNYGRYKMTSTTNNVIGNVNPDWIGGVYNTFKYKNLSLGFLIDVKKGGDVFSLDMYYGLATGILPETVGLNDLGNPSRDAVADGGGVIFPGVKPDGKPNDIRVENIYGTYGYSFNPAHNFVYDASYVKLRELNLTYTFPASVVSKLGPVKGIDLSLIGRNLWIIHKNLPYADPEENLSAGNAQGYQSGAYPTTRQIGVNAKLKF